jgi:T4 bacteriophage base plate protein
MRSQLLLPGGLYLEDKKKHYRDVQLRPIVGSDEELIASFYHGKSTNLQTVIEVLMTRCIERLGPLTEITIDTIRQLLIADRDYLTLKLRQITFGSKVQSTIRCPNQACGKMMDIDFDLDDVPVNAMEDIANNGGGGIFSLKLSGNAAYTVGNNKYDVVDFRLPNIGDVEQVSETARVDPAKAKTKLLARCIKRIGTISEITEPLIASMSDLTQKEIEEAMEQHSPSVNLEMDMECPECKYSFSTTFDIHRFLSMK